MVKKLLSSYPWASDPDDHGLVKNPALTVIYALNLANHGKLATISFVTDGIALFNCVVHSNHPALRLKEGFITTSSSVG